MSRKPRIAVIGAGIGGLATARALKLRGIDVTVYEQASRITEFGGGVVMTPNAMKALRHLGVEDAVLGHAFAPSTQVARSWRTGRVIDRTQIEGYGDRFGARFCCIHRGDLQKVLHEAVGNEPIRLTARCTAVSSEAGGAIARFEDGSEIEADAIIGADGIHSVVRASLFGAENPRFTGHMCWRGLADTSRVPAEIVRNEFTVWLGPYAHVVHYCVRRGELLNWVAITEVDAWREESWSCAGDMRELRSAYLNWNPHLLHLFDATERCYKWALFDREPLERWSKDRITLLGDSAHAMLPYLAQGAAQSLEDACVLAAQIDSTPDDLAGAFVRYERQRIPRTRRIQLGARARGALSHLPSAWARFRRDVALTLRRCFKPNAPLHQAEWIYRYDPGSAD